MSPVTLTTLWSHLLPGDLDAEDIEVIEGMATLPLRAAHRPYEATLGHRFLQTSERGDTVIRVRRDRDAGGVLLDLVSSDPAHTVEDWQPEIDVLDATVQTVQRLRRIRQREARPRAFIATPTFDVVPAPAGDSAAHRKLTRMLKVLHDAGIDTDQPDPAPAARWLAGSLALHTNLRYPGYPQQPPDVELIVVWDEAAGSGALLVEAKRFISRLRGPTVVTFRDVDRVVPFDRHYEPAGEAQQLDTWLAAALPDLNQRARSRQSLMYRLRRQLPRARARLTTLDQAVVERSGLSREVALLLLASPEAYAAATVGETYALHQTLGTEFVPHLQFRPPARLAAPVGLVPDHDWVVTVAGPFLTEPETEGLAAATVTTRATAELVTRAVERYLDMDVDTSWHGHREVWTTEQWSQLILTVRISRSDA